MIYFIMLRAIYFDESSVKHAFEGDWKEENTRLTTCDPHAKRLVTSSENPQEVEDKKDIIFTYDVEFQVWFHACMMNCQLLLV